MSLGASYHSEGAQKNNSASYIYVIHPAAGSFYTAQSKSMYKHGYPATEELCTYVGLYNTLLYSQASEVLTAQHVHTMHICMVSADTD